MSTAVSINDDLEFELRALEDVRLLVLGGICVLDDFDRDDLPIADRISASNQMMERSREPRFPDRKPDASHEVRARVSGRTPGGTGRPVR
jgi:hypothetical protein